MCLSILLPLFVSVDGADCVCVCACFITRGRSRTTYSMAVLLQIRQDTGLSCNDVVLKFWHVAAMLHSLQHFQHDCQKMAQSLVGSCGCGAQYINCGL